MQTNSFKLKRGFTLIELIITITILSILAVALLAALDPVEQFNRARDTGTRNSMLELHGAIQRYFSSQLKFPTCTTSNADGSCTTAINIGPAGSKAALITALTTIKELKTNFSSTAQTALSMMTISIPANTTDVYACFRPTSKSTQSDTNTKWIINASGVPIDNSAGPCSAAGRLTNASCVYCAQ